MFPVILLSILHTAVTMDDVKLDLLTPAYGEACGYQSCPSVQEDAINVHIVPHTYANVAGVNHFDQIYSGKYDFNVTSDLNMKKILDAVISELWGNPERKFTLSDMPYLFKWWSQRDGTVHRMVYQLLREGRLYLVGGGWSMNDEASTSYHAIIDSFTYSLRKLNNSFLECGRPLVAWQSLAYGHSREFASLIAQMGFDALFISPISYDDEVARMHRKALEFLWRGSDDLGADTDIFTHKLFDGFENPPGFCFASNCNDPLIITSDSVLSNVDERVDLFIDSILHRQLPHYNTSHVMVVMGTRLGYFDANMWFGNIEKLINYVNQRGPKEGKRLRLVYSTPACYLRAVHGSNPVLEPKQDDFFPFAYDRNTYLAGMYTSRPTVKWLVREGHVYLQMAKQMQVLAKLWNNDDKFEEFKWIMGVMQDHNIMSGHITEEVKSYYIKKLDRAIQVSTLIMRQGFNKLRKCNSTTLYYRCNFNISSCLNTNMKPVFVVIYNPLGWPVSIPVRLPTWNIEYKVYLPNGTSVPYALVQLPDPIVDLPNRGRYKVDHELVFIAENMPPLGYRSYFVHPNNIRLKRSVSSNMRVIYPNNFRLRQPMSRFTVNYRTEMFRGKRSVDNDDENDDWMTHRKIMSRRSINDDVFFHPNSFYLKRKNGKLPTKHEKGRKFKNKSTQSRYNQKPSKYNYNPFDFTPGRVNNYFRVKHINYDEKTTFNPIKFRRKVTEKYNHHTNSTDDEHTINDDNDSFFKKQTKESSSVDQNYEYRLKRKSLIKLNKIKPRKYLFVRQNNPVKIVDQHLLNGNDDTDYNGEEENTNDDSNITNVFDALKNSEISTTSINLVTAFYKIPSTTKKFRNAYSNNVTAFYKIPSTTNKFKNTYFSNVDAFQLDTNDINDDIINYSSTTIISAEKTKKPIEPTKKKPLEPLRGSIERTKSAGGRATSTYAPIKPVTSTFAPIKPTKPATSTFGPIKPSVTETTIPYYDEEAIHMEDDTSRRRAFDSVYSSDLFISNKYVHVNLQPNTRKVASIHLSNGVNISLDIQFMYYVSDEPEASSDKERKKYWPPGARVFRPVDVTPVSIIDSHYDAKVYKNSIVEEYHCSFTEWASLVLRLYAESPVIELDWLVGPVPIADTFGKEVFIRYTTNLDNEGVFYTDSNGRQTIKRIRDYRPTYVIPKKDPVEGNFYPVTSKIAIEDPKRNIRFSVFNDRAQGGASLNDGQIDVMLHRRIFTVDGQFILMNETEDGQGIRVRGKHYLYLTKADHKPNRIFEKKFAKEIEMRPQIFVSKPFPYGNHSKLAWESRVNEMSLIKKKLPIGVHLLTLEEWNDNTILIRLENYLEKSDTIKKGIKVVHLKDLFNNISIKSVKETTLAANIWYKDYFPLQWTKKEPFVYNFNKMYGNDNSDTVKASDDIRRDWSETDLLEEGIALVPQQIRTFVCSIVHV